MPYDKKKPMPGNMMPGKKKGQKPVAGMVKKAREAGQKMKKK